MASTKVQRIMTQPIKARIQIWLFEQKDLRIEGRIIVNVKKKSKKSLGRILLKGDNITLMMNTGK
ncbi:Small nuclear ribonucleoprotein E [Cucurbita argyrosperma subsp. argyrosperma]|nr:Small nuclear ribonucleoprotein E [Cucurbita argyrosperma subsp. argyrosperma]